MSFRELIVKAMEGVPLKLFCLVLVNMSVVLGAYSAEVVEHRLTGRSTVKTLTNGIVPPKIDVDEELPEQGKDGKLKDTKGVPASVMRNWLLATEESGVLATAGMRQNTRQKKRDEKRGGDDELPQEQRDARAEAEQDRPGLARQASQGGREEDGEDKGAAAGHSLPPSMMDKFSPVVNTDLLPRPLGGEGKSQRALRELQVQETRRGKRKRRRRRKRHSAPKSDCTTYTSFRPLKDCLGVPCMVRRCKETGTTTAAAATTVSRPATAARAATGTDPPPHFPVWAQILVAVLLFLVAAAVVVAFLSRGCWKKRRRRKSQPLICFDSFGSGGGGGGGGDKVQGRKTPGCQDKNLLPRFEKYDYKKHIEQQEDCLKHLPLSEPSAPPLALLPDPLVPSRVSNSSSSSSNSRSSKKSMYNAEGDFRAWRPPPTGWTSTPLRPARISLSSLLLLIDEGAAPDQEDQGRHGSMNKNFEPISSMTLEGPPNGGGGGSHWSNDSMGAGGARSSRPPAYCAEAGGGEVEEEEEEEDAPAGQEGLAPPRRSQRKHKKPQFFSPE